MTTNPDLLLIRDNRTNVPPYHVHISAPPDDQWYIRAHTTLCGVTLSDIGITLALGTVEEATCPNCRQLQEATQ